MNEPSFPKAIAQSGLARFAGDENFYFSLEAGISTDSMPHRATGF
jgi:hypothetical protein